MHFRSRGNMILQHLNQKTMNKVLPSLRNYISYLANFFFHFKIFSRVGCFVTTNIPGALLCYISLSSGLANIDDHHRNPNSRGHLATLSFLICSSTSPWLSMLLCTFSEPAFVCFLFDAKKQLGGSFSPHIKNHWKSGCSDNL